MSVQIKKNGVWEAVAGNATNTSGITESSALANIGTSANATQHDVNVAIDEAMSKSIKPITNTSSFQSNDLIGAKLVGITCNLYNMPGGLFKTTNIVTAGSSQCLTTVNPIANEQGVRSIDFDNSTGTLTFGEGYSIVNGTMSSNNDWCYPISYFVLSY